MGAAMNKSRKYAGTFTVVYASAIAVTVFSFLILGFSESLLRFVISLVAVLVAESAAYAYSLFWLKAAGSISHTPPVLISGAFITVLYSAAVFVSVFILDGVLEIPALWYGVEQLLLIVGGIIGLGAVGLYGWNAAMQERKTETAIHSHGQHLLELKEIGVLARSWKHPEALRLVETIDSIEDQFKYSDPVSSPDLTATEDIISQQLSLLHDQVSLLLALHEAPSDWETEINELIEGIAGTLKRRNRELAALK